MEQRLQTLNAVQRVQVWGGTDCRMPQQRQECACVVQGKGDIGEDVLLLAEKAVPAEGIRSRAGRLCRDTPWDTNKL